MDHEFREGFCDASSWLSESVAVDFTRDMVSGGVQNDESDKFGATTSSIKVLGSIDNDTTIVCWCSRF